MIRGSFHIVARMVALAVAIMVAVSVTGVSALLYSCSMTGELGFSKCGCPHEVQLSKASGPSLSATDCCEEISVDDPAQRTWVENLPVEIESPEVVALIPAVEAPPRVIKAVEQGVDNGPRGPPPGSGPPIFIKHCTFLI